MQNYSSKFGDWNERFWAMDVKAFKIENVLSGYEALLLCATRSTLMKSRCLLGWLELAI